MLAKLLNFFQVFLCRNTTFSGNEKNLGNRRRKEARERKKEKMKKFGLESWSRRKKVCPWDTKEFKDSLYVLDFLIHTQNYGTLYSCEWRNDSWIRNDVVRQRAERWKVRDGDSFRARERERTEGTKWMRIRKRVMKGRSIDNIVGGGYARLVNNEASTLSYSSLFFLLFPSFPSFSFFPSFFLSIFILSADSSHYNQCFWMITSLTLSKFLPTFSLTLSQLSLSLCPNFLSHFLSFSLPLSPNERYCSQPPTGLTSSWSLQRWPLT